MEHLKTDEIIEFVSTKEFTDESIELATKVNGHIRNCSQCLKVVRSFQMIFDEFERMSSGRNFKKFMDEKLSLEEKKNSIEIQNVDEEFNGYR